ncbi:MAG: YfiR family protein [Deltaproteobacteria bacterium]|nr:YfiR family protein [Deltaproteobacteria bacterium]
MKKVQRNIVRFSLCLILILPWIILSRVSFGHDPQNVSLHKITALYLYNFLLFVDWPEKVFSHSNTMRVVIYGDPQLYEAMKPMSGKMIKGKTLSIIYKTRLEKIHGSSHAIFVGHGDLAGVRELLGKLSGKPVLTVSDNAAFIGLGGMVSFNFPDVLPEKNENRKRFTVNLHAVRKSGLEIRSRLLRISDIINNPGPKSRAEDIDSHDAF